MSPTALTLPLSTTLNFLFWAIFFKDPEPLIFNTALSSTLISWLKVTSWLIFTTVLPPNLSFGAVPPT